MLKNAFSKFNELLLLQWFSDSIIKHKPVYGRYAHRLNFVYHSSLTSKLPLFNFLFQLADDSNFILHFGQNLLILSPQTISLHLFLVCSPSPFLTTGLAHTVFEDNQGIKGKAGVRATGKQISRWLRWFPGAGPASSQQLSIKIQGTVEMR